MSRLLLDSYSEIGHPKSALNVDRSNGNFAVFLSEKRENITPTTSMRVSLSGVYASPSFGFYHCVTRLPVTHSSNHKKYSCQCTYVNTQPGIFFILCGGVMTFVGRSLIRVGVVRTQFFKIVISLFMPRFETHNTEGENRFSATVYLYQRTGSLTNYGYCIVAISTPESMVS